jgi:Tfp pilus assembly protein PilF
VGATLETALNALRDAISVARAWRSRCLALEKTVKRALRYLEKGDAGTARKILLEALSEKVVEGE